MGDHKEVFRSLQELFPQVDPRMLKAIAIEHKKDVDSAVVAVLDEVMPSMTGMTGSLLSAHHEAVPFAADSAENLFANSTSEVGSSSSAGHETCIGEVNGSVHSAHQTSSVVDETITQEHVNNDSYIGGLTQMSSEHDYAPNFDVVHPVFSPKKVLANEVGCVGYLSTECFSPSSVGAKDGNSISIKAPQLYNKDSENITAIKDCISQNNSSKSFSGYMGLNDVGDLFLSGLAVASNDEVSPGTLSNEKDALEPLSDVPMLDTEVSSVELFGAKEQQDTSNTDSGYNEQPSGNAADNGDTPLSSNTDMLPDLNLNHFASTASTHSNHSVSIESLEDSISDARSIKNDLLPSLETVTKMIEDVELLEEKAKVAKHESSVAGKNILAKVEELKEMLTHAKEANDMHACEVSGEKSILTTEARELQSRLQRLSDERNRYLVVIEVIRQTLDERLVAAQQEIAAAEKEKIEKEAAAQALLEEQEKMMNSIVEESRRLQQEAEDNLKLKEFLVERGRIVDTLQGEMAVICEDVSQLKQMVDERVPLSKLHRSTMSSLSSSLHSSDATSVVAVESTDKHTVAEATAQGSHGNGAASRVISKRQDSNEGWDFVEDVQE